MVYDSHLECPVCHSTRPFVFSELRELPVYCNLLWDDRVSAQSCPKGDITLAFCPDCGLVYNTSFDSARLGYSQKYENSLHYSPRFQQYADELANRLVERHSLYGKTVIEVGCGKGDFLVSLCQLGGNAGIGFDNSYVKRPDHSNSGLRVEFIQDFYSEEYANYRGDFICCRQVLEHVLMPSTLLQPVRKAIGDSAETVVFFEVPNGLYTFRNMMIWDIIYEHCIYFTPLSLKYAFEANRYQVFDLEEEFGGQFLSIEARPALKESAPSLPSQASLKSLAEDISSFSVKFSNKVSQWESTLSSFFQQGEKVVIWGAGSKGVTFLNLLKLRNEIQYAVDINPRKQGKFVAGTGQEIVSPDVMKDYRPDVVIVMNPLYKEEIKDTLAQMGLNPHFLVV